MRLLCYVFFKTAEMEILILAIIFLKLGDLTYICEACSVFLSYLCGLDINLFKIIF